MTTVINEEVNVNAFYFRSGAQPGARDPRPAAGLKSFPRQIEWNGRFVTFAGEGLRYLVQHGSNLVQLFDMSDGQDLYRLRTDGSHWTLVGIKGGA